MTFSKNVVMWKKDNNYNWLFPPFSFCRFWGVFQEQNSEVKEGSLEILASPVRQICLSVDRLPGGRVISPLDRNLTDIIIGLSVKGVIDLLRGWHSVICHLSHNSQKRSFQPPVTPHCPLLQYPRHGGTSFAGRYLYRLRTQMVLDTIKFQ
jgi:hypothetical protein